MATPSAARHRVIQLDYHRPGRETIRYTQTLVVERNDATVLYQERYDGKPVKAGKSRILETGAPVVWFVFPDAWADVGRFHRADGTFTGWYTNLCTPMEKRGNDWASTDLFLDLWTPDSGQSRWLDEDEMEAAVSARVMDRWTAQRVKKERDRISALLEKNTWPPPVCREFDLAIVRSRLQQSGDI